MKALHRLLPSRDHNQPVKDRCCKTTGRKAVVSGGKLRQTVSLALEEDDKFDSSVRTADVDISDRSNSNNITDDATRRRRPAKVIGDTTHLAGRQLTSCMKVSSQSESLARIVQVKKKSLASSACVVPPTVSETPAVSTDDIDGYTDNFLQFFSSDTRISSRLNILDLSLNIEPEDAKNKTNVRFSTVAFREYKSVVSSDNPSTSIGPAIGLGWTYNPDEIVDLHQYESTREGLRRNKHQLILPVHVRLDMLRDAGYSRQEIFVAEMNGRKDKRLRMASVKHQKYDNVIEKIDTVKWRVKRIIPTK